MKHATTALAVFCSLFALYGAFGPMITQISRFTHVMLVIMLTFLFYPAARRWKERGLAFDVVLAFLAFVAFAYPFIDLEPFMYRVANPSPTDVFMGVLACALVLEATRRATGAALPILVVLCIVYAMLGGCCPSPGGTAAIPSPASSPWST